MCFFDISQRCQQNGKVGVLKLLSLGQVRVRRPPRGVRLGVPHHHHRAVGRQGLGVSRLDVQLAEEAIFLVAGGERHRQPTFRQGNLPQNRDRCLGLIVKY